MQRFRVECNFGCRYFKDIVKAQRYFEKCRSKHLMQEQASGSGALAGFVSVLSASRKVLRKARPADLFGHSLPDTLS